MALMGFRSRGRNLKWWGAWSAAVALASLVWAQDVSVSAKVDKTTVSLGEPVGLTVTLSGDVSGVQLAPIPLPNGWVIVGRSPSTNFSVHAGAAERSTALQYVLIPQQAGTFRLGPFQFEQGQKEFRTEPIEITVKKPSLPPHLPSHTERFTL